MNSVLRTRRVRILVVLSLVVVSMLLGPGIGRTYAFHAATFAANATGLAVTPSRFLIVSCDGDEVRVQSVGASGVLPGDFAHTPDESPTDVSGCLNPSIAIAPSTDGYLGSGVPRQNFAGFRSGYAYITQTTSAGTTIWQVDLAGVVTSFLALTAAQCAAPSYADLAFQTVETDTITHQGPFGNHGLMFITCTNGKIWKVNNASSPSTVLIIDLLTQGIDNIQGPNQAPTGFTPASGYLCVASPTEGPGRVFCVNNAGGVATVNDTWPDANGLDFFPGTCTYEPGTTGDAQGGNYYVSTPAGAGTIFKYLPSGFKTPPGSFANAALVTRAGTNQPNKGLGKLTPPSGGTIAAYDAHPGRFHRDAAFVDCSIPSVVIVDVSPGEAGTVINQKSHGTVPVAIVGSAVVPATSIDPLSVRCGFTGGPGDAQVISYQIKDISGPDGNPDGILDFVGYFERTEMNLPSTPSPWRGPIFCRGTYSAGNDPRFDGGG